MSRFITFEGLDCSGKSTQITRAAQALRDFGHAVRVLREPGGTRLGEAVRSIVKTADYPITPFAELMLFTAARAQLIEEDIKPGLQRGEIILCDRFWHSTVAYQGGGRGVPLPVCFEILENTRGLGVSPHLTLYFRVSLETVKARMAKRPGGADRFDNLGDEFFGRVGKTYSELPLTHIDGERDEDAVHEEVMVHLHDLLSKCPTFIHEIPAEFVGKVEKFREGRRFVYPTIQSNVTPS